MTREVVLVSGLWMPAAGMALLAARLRRQGYATRLLACRGRDPMVANVERLARYAREALEGRRAHFIGHLGGLLILPALGSNPDIAVEAHCAQRAARSCCEAAVRARHGMGRWMMGAAATDRDGTPGGCARALGIMARAAAGNRARARRATAANDGVVRVEEIGRDGGARFGAGRPRLLITRRAYGSRGAPAAAVR